MRRTARLLILLPASLLILGVLIGCGDNEPSDPLDAATLSSSEIMGPHLAMDKEAVDIWGVRKDEKTFQTFLIMNRGDQPLEIGVPRIRAIQGCDVVTTAQQGTTIPPGEVNLLSVLLGRHLESGPHEIAVDIPSNDPNRPITTVVLRFDVSDEAVEPASGPRLLIDKSGINIGVVPLDWPMFERFGLRNIGDETIVLDGIPKIKVLEGC